MAVNKKSKAMKTGAPPSDTFEQVLQTLLKLSSEWYWEQDENFQLTLVTRAVVEKDGVDPKWYLGKARWDDGAIPVEDDHRWDKHKAVLESRQVFKDFIYSRVDATGECRYFSTSGEPVFDVDGAFRGYRGLAKDVTETIRAEQLLRLEHEVTRCLAEADTAVRGLKNVMGVVCKYMSWECCRYFQVDERAGVLRFANAWFVPERRTRE
jgi:PAS domain S-box-containing protein